MATSTPPSDYFTGRPAIRTRPPPTVLGERQRTGGTPGSPRTPLLGRSVSSQFGSPGSFRAEPEDVVIYELGARHLSAGFAGEGRPRCIVRFGPESGRRVGDFRQWDATYSRPRRKHRSEDEWGQEYELYHADLRSLDLGLVTDKLEHAVRHIHTDYLQLDTKPRKAVLALPSLLPTPLLEIALKVIFNHFSQPPSVTILTTPILACVGAGLRHALVVEVGWEETVVTAVGEYKEVFQRRSVRAGKMVTRETAKVLEAEVKKADSREDGQVAFETAEAVTERMAWCRPRADLQLVNANDSIKSIPVPSSGNVKLAFTNLADPAEHILFPTSKIDELDDHDLPLPALAYRVLLALPLDLRTICMSRIIVTGGCSSLPGLKTRLLHELENLIERRGWDQVERYGSAAAHHERVLRERDANITSNRAQSSPTKKNSQDSVPPSQRPHDDIRDPITLKAERHTLAAAQAQGKDGAVKGVVRGVETLGAWSDASLVASLRVNGVHEVEREEFLKHGLKEGSRVY